MKRVSLTILASIIVMLVIALSLFAFDLENGMRNDASLEAYGRTGNHALLPPNATLGRRLTWPVKENETAWNFFVLMWMRNRLDALIWLGLTAITAPLLINLWLFKRHKMLRI